MRGRRRRPVIRQLGIVRARILTAGRLAATWRGGDDGSGAEGGVKLSRPDNPVTLPTFDDIGRSRTAWRPRPGTLKVYNYAEYIAPSVLGRSRRSTA